MSPLSPASSAALARLRAFRPPSPSVYASLPLTRRAAVLVLLFADRRGDLRVVLTVRSPLLRTYAGHVALPGGKADYLLETAQQTARREAYEEIGLPLENQSFPRPFKVDHLCELPCSLARTLLGVRPCVAWLRDGSEGAKGVAEDALIPKLEEAEVSSLFTVLLERFLHRTYPLPGDESMEEWYRGERVTWMGRKWGVHEFMAPVWQGDVVKRHRVWGMTSRILLDVARIAYGRDPEFECDSDLRLVEDVIWKMKEEGKMEEIIRKKMVDPEVDAVGTAGVGKGNL